MMDKLRYLVLINSVLTIIGGVLMILDGLDLLQLGKPLRVAFAVCMFINAAVNCINYSRVRRQQQG